MSDGSEPVDSAKQSITQIRKICSKCGSNDVVKDAWASWSEIDQQWELSDTFDAAYCNNCEGECSIEEEPLT